VSDIKLPIYLDYSATTPIDQRVADKMLQYLTIDGEFGNPASRSHAFGWSAEAAVDEARQNVADLLNCDPREIVWTSGATESDNLAIKGAAHFYRKKGNHIITLKTEHKAVLDTCRQLEREGFEVTYMDPEENGLLDLDKLKAAITDQTILISIMHVNNEIGVIQDIEAIGEIARERKIIFHVDAAQSPGKVEIDLQKLKVDLMSLCAHKIYGPKGIGALYVRRKPRVRIEAQMHGGGHERGMRSGTLATHQIVGMGEAFRLAREEMATENDRIRMLRDRLYEGLNDMEEVYVNGDLDHRIAGCATWRYLQALPVPRPASSRLTYCVLSGATTNSRTVRSALPSGVSPPSRKSTIRSNWCAPRLKNYAICRRFGICTKTASI
jgi:cysteine desulfurase